MEKIYGNLRKPSRANRARYMYYERSYFFSNKNTVHSVECFCGWIVVRSQQPLGSGVFKVQGSNHAGSFCFLVGRKEAARRRKVRFKLKTAFTISFFTELYSKNCTKSFLHQWNSKMWLILGSAPRVRAVRRPLAAFLFDLLACRSQKSSSGAVLDLFPRGKDNVLFV
jgi:hypothetical protein